MTQTHKKNINYLSWKKLKKQKKKLSSYSFIFDINEPTQKNIKKERKEKNAKKKTKTITKKWINKNITTKSPINYLSHQKNIKKERKKRKKCKKAKNNNKK